MPIGERRGSYRMYELYPQFFHMSKEDVVNN